MRRWAHWAHWGPWARWARWVHWALLAAALGVLGCQDLARFETEPGEAYCGDIVTAPFARTPLAQGGFRTDLRLRLHLDVNNLSSQPGRLSSADKQAGPCAPQPTFDEAVIEAIPEVQHDELFLLNFGTGRDHNVLGWVNSSCRGPMLAVLSLLRSNNVEVRLLTPPPRPDNTAAAAQAKASARAGFASFLLQRRQGSCFDE